VRAIIPRTWISGAGGSSGFVDVNQKISARGPMLVMAASQTGQVEWEANPWMRKHTANGQRLQSEDGLRPMIGLQSFLLRRS
jgi:hypothetical protein